jgi:heme-degrading monooxygenase HmoA
LFVTLWEFEVKRGSEELFERVYWPDGEWAQLFRRDARYRAMRLLRDVGAERVYVTMDEWESRAAYEEFRARFAVEYGKLDRKFEGITAREKHLGECESLS